MSYKLYGRSKARRNPRTKHWEIQFSLGKHPDGRRHRPTITGRTKAEATARADAFQETVQFPGREPSGYTVANYLNHWYAAKRASWKARTRELYRHQIDRHIVPHVGNMRLDDLSPLEIQKMMTAIVDSGHISTANKCRRQLFSALKQAVRWGLLDKNPVEAVDPVRERPAKTRLWTPAEARTFLDATASHRLHAAFYLLIASGLRRGEVLGLRWSDVQKDGISIEQTLVLVGNEPTFATPKTDDSERFVALDDETLAILAAHKARQDRERDACGAGWQDHDLVFCTEIGTPLHPRNLLRTLYTLSKQAGVPKVSLHSLRHLHTSLLIAKGQDPKSISDRLGHSSTAFTLDRYGHIFQAYRHRTALPLDTLLGDEEDDE